jgi:ribosome maturation factor RimP
MDVEALVRPVVESSGLELVEVSFRKEGGRRILRVTVDREGGVDLDTISEASERLSRRLDLQGFASGSYTLEVSSPGVERPLRSPHDFERRVGERVRVKTARPVDGSRTHTGTLVRADPEGITVATDAGERRIEHGDMSSARTVFDWDRGSRGVAAPRAERAGEAADPLAEAGCR